MALDAHKAGVEASSGSSVPMESPAPSGTSTSARIRVPKHAANTAAPAIAHAAADTTAPTAANAATLTEMPAAASVHVEVKLEKPTTSPRTRIRKKIPDALLIGVFLVGLAVLCYPAVSNYYNALIQSRAISSYDSAVAHMKPEDFTALWQDAEQYNAEIASRGIYFNLSKEEYGRYGQLLNVAGTGMMGYITIPKLRVELPIYHGVSEGVLQIASGHIPGSSLPTGGESTHVVLSGHRGLPSSKLFTDLDQLQEGDSFALHVLDRTLSYQVDQIRTVEPQEVQDLELVSGQDYVTLVTCTPYAINTHRLLVRGHRVPYLDADYVQSDAVRIDPVLVATVVTVPIFIAIFGYLMIRRRHQRKRVAAEPSSELDTEPNGELGTNLQPRSEADAPPRVDSQKAEHGASPTVAESGSSIVAARGKHRKAQRKE